MSTPTPTLTGAYTCTHRSDQMRAACPVCLVASLTAERDRLRAELEKVYVLVTPVGFDLPGGIFETAQAVTELRAERDQLRADRTYNHECINRLAVATGTLGENSEKVVDVVLSTIAQLHALQLVCGTTDADKFSTWVDRANARAKRAEAELATERARLDYLLKWDVTFNSREDIDRDINGAAK